MEITATGKRKVDEDGCFELPEWRRGMCTTDLAKSTPIACNGSKVE